MVPLVVPSVMRSQCLPHDMAVTVVPGMSKDMRFEIITPACVPSLPPEVLPAPLVAAPVENRGVGEMLGAQLCRISCMRPEITCLGQFYSEFPRSKAHLATVYRLK